MAKNEKTPTVPAIVHEVSKSSTPQELILNLIKLCTFGTPYKWASTSWASEVPTLNGTKKLALNDIYRTLAARKGFTGDDLDPIVVTTRLAAEGVIVSRWFTTKTGRSMHKITASDPNYTKSATQQAASDF